MEDATQDSQQQLRTTIWIVEDRDLLRESYAAIIEGADGLALGLACRRCEEAVAALEAGALPDPDIVLMDIELPGMSGVVGVEEVLRRRPEVKVVMLTIHADRNNVFEALRAGATGYLLKPSSEDEIVRAIADLHAGSVPMSPQIARRVLSIFQNLGTPEAEYGLSRRESEVLDHLVEARTNAEIAKTLFISEHTVGNHIRSIYRKLHVHSRAAAVGKAIRERLV